MGDCHKSQTIRKSGPHTQLMCGPTINDYKVATMREYGLKHMRGVSNQTDKCVQ